jgi:hypothetical protein
MDLVNSSFNLIYLEFRSTTVQTLMYTGIGYSSPTLSSAMVDLLPAFTFILAVISRFALCSFFIYFLNFKDFFLLWILSKHLHHKVINTKYILFTLLCET